MVETRASTGSRSADGRRFEVFVRETAAESLRHVGTVAAPTPETAHEEAAALFGWTARDIWVCPTESTPRHTTEPLAADEDVSVHAGHWRSTQTETSYLFGPIRQTALCSC